MGGFFPKNFFWDFLIYIWQKGLSPLFGYKRGRQGRGDTSPPLQGRGMGELTGRGYTKTPTIKDGG